MSSMGYETEPIYSRIGCGMAALTLYTSLPMFTFFNTVEVLPPASVDVIHHFLRDSGLPVPVVLKAKSGMPGFVALHAWIPLSEPVCRLLPTELVVNEGCGGQLRHILLRFVREVQNVMKLAEREALLHRHLAPADVGNSDLDGQMFDRSIPSIALTL